MFQGIKEQNMLYFLQLWLAPFFLPLCILGWYKIKEIETKVKNQLFATKETNKGGRRKKLITERLEN